jgi:hypothetical protein
MLLTTLNSVSELNDGKDINRYGWLYPSDIEVLSALAIPIGQIRDPFGLRPGDRDQGDTVDTRAINTFGYFMLGIAVSAVIIIVVLLFLHFKLRQEYALISKDKTSLAKSSATLRKLWTKFASFSSNNFGTGSGPDGERNVELSRIRQEQENQMSKLSLMTETDEDYDEEI